MIIKKFLASQNKKLIMRKKIIFFPFGTLLLGSCSYQEINPEIHKISSEISKIKVDKELVSSIKTGADVTITIENKSFNKKAITDAVFPKTSIDVKSYQIFLTSDFNNPFTTGANVSQDTIYKFSSTRNTFTFRNIPDGGPYWAVISAWDGTESDPLAQNITEPDLTLLSIDQKWARSTNTVTVLSKIPTYSDSSNSLNLNLQLKQGVKASVDMEVSIVNGDPASTIEDITQ